MPTWVGVLHRNAAAIGKRLRRCARQSGSRRIWSGPPHWYVRRSPIWYAGRVAVPVAGTWPAWPPGWASHTMHPPTADPRGVGLLPHRYRDSGEPAALGGERHQMALQRLAWSGADQRRVAGGDGVDERADHTEVPAVVTAAVIG